MLVGALTCYINCQAQTHDASSDPHIPFPFLLYRHHNGMYHLHSRHDIQRRHRHHTSIESGIKTSRKCIEKSISGIDMIMRREREYGGGDPRPGPGPSTGPLRSYREAQRRTRVVCACGRRKKKILLPRGTYAFLQRFGSQTERWTGPNGHINVQDFHLGAPSSMKIRIWRGPQTPRNSARHWPMAFRAHGCSSGAANLAV